MTPDHYATLGLSPTSEDVVIRAAYRALIRRYHPDGNDSPTAAARSRAINAAYAVLVDPAQRADYDKLRAAEAWPLAPLRRSPLTAPSRIFAAASVAVLLVVVYLITWSPMTLVTPAEHVTFVPPRIPNFVRDVPILPRASPEVVAVPEASEAPVADPQLEESLPLPTPLPVLGAPRLTAQTTAPKPRLAKRAAPQPAAATALVRAQAKAVPTSNPDLANLDRQQGLLYTQSWLRADAPKRARLQATRTRFLARRDGCRSGTCTRAAYLDRMREVGQIMIAPAKADPKAP
ncbi:MAG: J domain-containing protein [Sphingomicrobium sp.]